MRQPLSDKELQFRKDALSFLIELCVQIRSRFPMSQDCVLAQMQLLEPKIALSDNKPYIIPLALEFPTVVSEEHLDHLFSHRKSH